MSTQIIVGQEVTLRSALGEITRTVCRIYDDVVVVCSAEEWRSAQKERREPDFAIGFKRSDVVGARGLTANGPLR